MDNPARISDILERSEFFAGLAPEISAELAAIASLKKYRTGETIFEEGAPGTGFHLVAEGRVKIYKSSPDGREQILHLFDQGQLFGEVAIFFGRGYPASAQALGPSRTVFFPRQGLLELIGRNPDMAFALLGLMAQRLARFTVLLESVTLKEAPARLAAFILSLAGETDQAELTITKTQLASLLGSTPETISRALGRLKNQALIKEEKPRIIILDRDRLKDVADGLANAQDSK